MGVIQRKSIHFSMVNFAGVIIGTLSTLFIYPLSREAYGLARFFIDFAWLLYPLVLFGMDSVSLKYFPRFQKTGAQPGSFLTFLLTNVAVITFVFVVVAYVFGSSITHWLDEVLDMRFHKDPLIDKYLWILVPLVFFTGVTMLFNRYFSSFHRIAFPAVLINFIKVSTPILVLLYYFDYVDIWVIPYGLLGHFSLIFIASLVYLAFIGEWRFKFDFSIFQGERYKEILTFSLYSLFASLGTLIAFRIDTVMVGTLLNLDQTGEFGIAATIAQTIAIPTNAIITVAAPVIAAAWAEKDMKQIDAIYKKASNNLLIPGLIIYTGMWACIDYLFAIMPNSDTFSAAKWVVLILGAAKLFDMATSVNNEIIAYSKHYTFNFYAVATLSVSNIAFNLIFISSYGIIGAAMATLLSLFLYNVAKLIFIRFKFGIQPFSIQTIKLLAIALFCYGTVFWWEFDGRSILNLLLKGTVVTVLYVFLAFQWKVSDEFSKLIHTNIKRLIKK